MADERHPFAPLRDTVKDRAHFAAGIVGIKRYVYVTVRESGLVQFRPQVASRKTDWWFQSPGKVLGDMSHVRSSAFCRDGK